MTWTRKAPTIYGFYWYRWKPEDFPYVVSGPDHDEWNLLGNEELPATREMTGEWWDEPLIPPES